MGMFLIFFLLWLIERSPFILRACCFMHVRLPLVARTILGWACRQRQL